MTTRVRSSPPKFRARWHNPLATQAPRVTLARAVRGQVVERAVGPRGRLTLEEAAAVLDRPVSQVRRAIRTRFLPARRDRGHVAVTVAACHRFLVEEREDGDAAAAAMERMRRAGAKLISSDHVFQELGLE